MTAACNLEMLGSAGVDVFPGLPGCPVKNIHSLSTEELAELVKHGGPEAASAGEVIVERLALPLRGSVIKMGVSEDVAEVILQETWIRFFRSAVYRFSGPSLLAFLRGIARKVFQAWLRWKRTRRVFSFADFSSEDAAMMEALAVAGEVGPEQFGEELDRTVEFTEIQNALEMLGAKAKLQREVIERLYGEGKSYGEIAAELEVSVSSVKNAAHKGRLSLKKLLSPFFKRNYQP